MTRTLVSRRPSGLLGFSVTPVGPYLLAAGEWALCHIPVGQFVNGEKSSDDDVSR